MRQHGKKQKQPRNNPWCDITCLQFVVLTYNIQIPGTHGDMAWFFAMVGDLTTSRTSWVHSFHDPYWAGVGPWDFSWAWTCMENELVLPCPRCNSNIYYLDKARHQSIWETSAYQREHCHQCRHTDLTSKRTPSNNSNVRMFAHMHVWVSVHLTQVTHRPSTKNSSTMSMAGYLSWRSMKVGYIPVSDLTVVL